MQDGAGRRRRSRDLPPRFRRRTRTARLPDGRASRAACPPSAARFARRTASLRAMPPAPAHSWRAHLSPFPVSIGSRRRATRARLPAPRHHAGPARRRSATGATTKPFLNTQRNQVLPCGWPRTVLGHLVHRETPFSHSGLLPRVRLPSGPSGPGFPHSLLGQKCRSPGTRGPHDRAAEVVPLRVEV